MSKWADFANSPRFQAICPDSVERDYWRTIFDMVASGRIDTWDYQMILACWLNNGLTVRPNLNLVTNIGFRPYATHTSHKTEFADILSESFLHLTHPTLVSSPFEPHI